MRGESSEVRLSACGLRLGCASFVERLLRDLRFGMVGSSTAL